MEIDLLLRIIEKYRKLGRWSKDAPITFEILTKSLEELKYRQGVKVKKEVCANYGRCNCISPYCD